MKRSNLIKVWNSGLVNNGLSCKQFNWMETKFNSSIAYWRQCNKKILVMFTRLLFIQSLSNKHQPYACQDSSYKEQKEFCLTNMAKKQSRMGVPNPQATASYRSVACLEPILVSGRLAHLRSLTSAHTSSSTPLALFELHTRVCWPIARASWAVCSQPDTHAAQFQTPQPSNDLVAHFPSLPSLGHQAVKVGDLWSRILWEFNLLVLSFWFSMPWAPFHHKMLCAW